ncbi:MAG TPA: cytochrome c nitrite reductase small subunit [Anaerolineales bacterium]|nr:cytochrome c nitrite reductase small subunit [Anaerolineales bacterium]
MLKKILLLVGILVFVAALGLFAWATDASSYLGHEPSTCNNCHVMDAQYENWTHAAHARVAVCVDCHLPHQNAVSYYLYKGYSGMKDVLSFTFKTYPDSIRATQQTDQIIQANCIRCHSDTVENIVAGPQPFDRYCWSCHRSVAHGERGLTLYPEQDSEVYKK